MSPQLDRQTLEHLRRLAPRQAFFEAKEAVYRAGATSSADFLDLFEQLVEQGILSWEEIEEFDG